MAKKNRKMSLLGGLLAEGLEAGFKVFMNLTKDEQKDVVKQVVASHRKMLNDIMMRSHSVQSTVLKEMITGFVNEMEEHLQWVYDLADESPIHAFFSAFLAPIVFGYELANSLFAFIFSGLREMFEPKEPVTFEKAIENAEKFFTIVGDLNVLAALFDTIGKTEIFGIKLGLDSVGRLVTNISWTFGLGWLTWVAMGPVFRWSIADPYEREMRKRLRPRDFTKSEIEDLYEWGLKKLEELHDYYVELGYSDDKIQQLLEILRKRIFSSEVRKYITTLETNYADGYVSDQELAEALSLGYWTDDERKFLFWRAKQRRINKINDLRVKEIERAFLERRIDEDEATSRLTEFIKDPSFVEALIAYWKQRLKPEEEVEPPERLLARKKRLEIRIKGLQDQITYLQEYLRERLELYDVMLRELEQRYTARMQRIEEVYDSRINALQDEFQIWQKRRIEELKARIAEIDAELTRFIQIYIAQFNGNLQRISDETLSASGYTRQQLLNMFLNARFDELLDALSVIGLYITEKERTALSTMLRIVNRYFDLVERRNLLQKLVELRIEEREAYVQYRINKLREEKMRKIAELQAKLADEKEKIERKKRIEEIRINMRISKLQSKVDELSVELSSINKQLEGAT